MFLLFVLGLELQRELRDRNATTLLAARIARRIGVEVEARTLVVVLEDLVQQLQGSVLVERVANADRDILLRRLAAATQRAGRPIEEVTVAVVQVPLIPLVAKVYIVLAGKAVLQTDIEVSQLVAGVRQRALQETRRHQGRRRRLSSLVEVAVRR